MTVKFMYNGVKVDNVLYKGSYSTGHYNEASKFPKETIRLRAKSHPVNFPAIKGTSIENFFGKDTLMIFPNSPYYADAKAAYDKYNAKEITKQRSVQTDFSR